MLSGLSILPNLAAGLGFEPRWIDSESIILPLDDPAMKYLISPEMRYFILNEVEG